MGYLFLFNWVPVVFWGGVVLFISCGIEIRVFRWDILQHVPTHAIAPQMTGFGASLVEGVMTFTLVYTVYAAADTKRGPSGVIGPLMIGLIAGANILASGPFTGGSMTPAYSFGSALVGGSFKNQAVYWVGPLIGAAMAGLLYDNVVFPARSPDARGLAEGGV